MPIYSKNYKDIISNQEAFIEEYGRDTIIHIGRYRTPKSVIRVNRAEEIYIKCDKCGKEFIDKSSRDYKKKDYFKETLCKECKMKKTILQSYDSLDTYFIEKQIRQEETMLKKYKAKSSFQVEKFKMKAKITKNKKYGDENYNNRNKAKKTNLINYGIEGIPRSSSCKKEISEKSKAFYQSPEGLAYRQQLSLNKKELYKDQNNHLMYGKHMSEEAKEKNRQSQFKNIDNGFRYGTPSNYELGEFYSEKLHKVIKYRSSYERTFLFILENTSIDYQYENLVIPYYFEGKEHRYLPDIELHYKNKHFLIEIKPKKLQMNPVVLAKKEAAEQYCKNHNLVYRFLDQGEFMKFILADLDLQVEDFNKNYLDIVLKSANKIAMKTNVA